LETTNRYAEITIRTKEEALRQCEPTLGHEETYPGKRIWRQDPSLLDWLDAL
jgi:hypothetical protein